MKITTDEKSQMLVKEYTVCTVATILLTTLVGAIIAEIKDYNLCPSYVLHIFYGLMILLIMFYVMPAIMLARYRSYEKKNAKKPELPSVKYHTDRDGIPDAIKFNNSNETKLSIILFENRAEIYANNSNYGTSIFSGNVNMCLREISDNWNNCKEYTMSIGTIPVDSNGTDIRTDSIDRYHNFNLTLTESDQEKMNKKNKSEDSKE